MSKPTRAVLRNENNEHISTLNPDETEIYELLAERGKVHRSQKMKKGRLIIIFRMIEAPNPPFEPSLSPESSCSLTDHDSLGIAGMAFDLARTTRGQIERWFGWGLITEFA